MGFAHRGSRRILLCRSPSVNRHGVAGHNNAISRELVACICCFHDRARANFEYVHLDHDKHHDGREPSRNLVLVLPLRSIGALTARRVRRLSRASVVTVFVRECIVGSARHRALCRKNARTFSPPRYCLCSLPASVERRRAPRALLYRTGALRERFAAERAAVLRARRRPTACFAWQLTHATPNAVMTTTVAATMTAATTIAMALVSYCDGRQCSSFFIFAR